jgi:hypothetical protein
VQEFVLPVTVNENEINYNARLVRAGYIYKIEVDVNDLKIQFEKDEEGEWRAFLNEQDIQTNKTNTKELLSAFVESIDYITK